jgi:hypothetical protein
MAICLWVQEPEKREQGHLQAAPSSHFAFCSFQFAAASTTKPVKTGTETAHGT